MRIMTIDPGTYESAFVVYDQENHSIDRFGFVANDDLRRSLANAKDVEKIICEGIQSYGMPVGQETFDTCIYIGRLWERCECCGIPFEIMFRKAVMLQLCNTSRAKDGNIRQALLDRFERSGGGKVPQIGIKKKPGPLFGVSNHIWSALAIAIAYTEAEKEGAR